MEQEIKAITQEDFINYLKFKIKTIVPSVFDQINYEHVEPGYVLSKEADERFKFYLECRLCGHVADELQACNVCSRSYCRYFL